MEFEWNVEYPCGFKMNGRANVNAFSMGNIMAEINDKDIREKGCPLHGKKCVRKK